MHIRFASWRRFLGDESGAAAIIFSLSSVLIILTAGVAIDYGRWQAERTDLQSVADSAVLAAAQQFRKSNWSRSSIEQVLARYISPNGADLQGVTIEDIRLTPGQRQLSVVLAMPASRSFTALFTSEPQMIRVQSTAEVGTTNATPTCVLALDAAMSKAMEGSGGTSFRANQCSVKVNSSSSTAVNLSGGSSLSSAQNCFEGGVQQGLANVTPAPQKCGVTPDPFSGLALPAIPNSCASKNSYSGSATLSPGLYCGGLTLSSGTFTFQPGLYIIRDGDFVSSGGSTMTGDGVTFLLMGTGAGVVWSGGGNYRFRAMATGELAGFIIYLDPKATPASKSVVSGGGNTTYEGVFYFPRQKLELSGGSTAATPSPFTAFVANNFLFSGASQLNINVDAAKATVPIPSGLYGAAGGPRLIN